MMSPEQSDPTGILVLGIGNLLMGDEGVGVHVVRHLQSMCLPAGVDCLDGGTGSFLLLEPMQDAGRVILVDATVDEYPSGTVRRLRPRFSRDYPRTLTAHDIGLKDLLDAFYLLGDPPQVTLFAVSIPLPRETGLTLSPAIASRVPAIARQVLEEAAG
jgi:hydrogenase maturation protease